MAVFGRIIELLCNCSSSDNGSIYFRISQSARLDYAETCDNVWI